MNKIAMVSGASAGLGRSIARELAARDWDVVLGARRLVELRAVASEIEEAGRRAYAASLDLTFPESIDAFVAETSKAMRPVDLLVNNAGFAVPGAFAEQSLEELSEVFEINLIGTLALTRSVIATWPDDSVARTIIFISSSQAVATTPHLLSYGASKLAIEYMADGLRAELRSRNVRAVTVRLGAVETDFRANFNPERTMSMAKFWQENGIAAPTSGRGRMSSEQAARAITDCLTEPLNPYVEILDLRA